MCIKNYNVVTFFQPKMFNKLQFFVIAKKVNHPDNYIFIRDE